MTIRINKKKAVAVIGNLRMWFVNTSISGVIKPISDSLMFDIILSNGHVAARDIVVDDGGRIRLSASGELCPVEGHKLEDMFGLEALEIDLCNAERWGFSFPKVDVCERALKHLEEKNPGAQFELTYRANKGKVAAFRVPEGIDLEVEECGAVPTFIGGQSVLCITETDSVCFIGKDEFLLCYRGIELPTDVGGERLWSIVPLLSAGQIQSMAEEAAPVAA